MAKLRWWNNEHPPTLQIAVALSYLTALEFVLQGGSGISLGSPVAVLIGVVLVAGAVLGAVQITNNRTWGYQLCTSTSVVIVGLEVLLSVWYLAFSFPGLLAIMFGLAVVYALVCPASRHFVASTFH